MDEPAKPPQRDWVYLAILFVLVVPLRGWLLYNTEVPARDFIGYVRYALEFERMPWGAVLRGEDQHPGYPAAIVAMSMPLRHFLGTSPETMRLAAQLVSAIAALLLMLPMYFLGKELFTPTIAFWGTFIFQILPVSGQHLSDGISEALFFLLMASSLYWGVRAMRGNRAFEFALCGLFGGLAYLTRPEGALVVLAVGLVLVAMQIVRSSRRPWSQFLACGTSLALMAVLVGGVYVYATGRLTNKRSARQVLHDQQSSIDPAGHQRESLTGAPLLGSIFGATFQGNPSAFLRLGQSIIATTQELVQGLHYIGVIPALLGLCLCWPRLKRLPGFWVLATYGAIHAFVLINLAMTVFYVSDRHTMVLVMGSCYFISAGLLALPEWLRNARPAWSPMIRPGLATMLLLAMVAISLPKTVQRLHANRVGNHGAGLWLRDHLAKGDVIIDTHGWSHFYSGLIFEEGREPILDPHEAPTTYVVLTRSSDAEIERERKVLESQLTDRDKVVFHWPAQETVENARIVVYAGPRNFATHPWRVAENHEVTALARP